MAQKTKAKKQVKAKKGVKTTKTVHIKKKEAPKSTKISLHKKVTSNSNHNKVAVTGSVKTKLKAKIKAAPPLKKIEKIIDISQLETKFKEIAHFNSTES